MIGPAMRARLERDVWMQHDAGSPMSEIAEREGISESDVHAIIMDAWTDGVAGWKCRHGIGAADWSEQLSE